MIESIFFTGPNKTVIGQERKVIGYVYIGLVFFVECHTALQRSPVDEQQIQIVLVPIEHLRRQGIGIGSPLQTRNIKIVIGR